MRAASHFVRLLAVTILLLVTAGVARAQISPGPLSRAHQSVSGPTQCGSCHRFGAGKADFKCLDCHTEIATRLAEQRGLHQSLIGNRVANQSCASCHSEHNGENFNLIRWDPSPKSFDHSKTGYALEGKHAGLECKSCHAPAHIAEAERRKIVMKDASRTFLGLSRDCLSCHKDEHRGQLGPNCQQCHTFADWKTVSQFALAAQKRFSAAAVESLLHFPDAEQVKRMPMLAALGAMVALDLRRLLRVMALRRHALGGAGKWLTLGGMLPADNDELERTIRAVRDQASLAKRILFFDRAQRVFQLWHVVHRPFSYSFSVLALVHILVVMMFGMM